MPRLALLLTTLIWGATFPATKAVLEQVPPLTFLFLRFVIAASLVFAVLRFSGRRLPRDPFTLRISFIATVWLFLGYVLQTVGLHYTTASNSAFITVLYVVFVPIFLRRWAARGWLAALLAMVGLWFLVKPEAGGGLGDLLTLSCAVAFAAHIACLERFTRVADPVAVFAWQLAFVTPALFGMMVWESPSSSAFALTPVLTVALGITGLFATGAFAVQVWAQRLLPAQQVALLFSLEPACASWLAWYFLGETMDAHAWLGSLLILAGVLMGSLQDEPLPAMDQFEIKSMSVK
ncbi:MAG TPA: DMT family transporter [Nitrospiraceae bacterium]|nr:DMT family transporter [Nitrospiraceae bacterium]